MKNLLARLHKITEKVKESEEKYEIVKEKEEDTGSARKQAKENIREAIYSIKKFLELLQFKAKVHDLL